MSRFHTEETKQAVADMWAEGLSARQIGNTLHLTRNAVIGIVHRLDLPRRIITYTMPPRKNHAPAVKIIAPPPDEPVFIGPSNGDFPVSGCKYPRGNTHPYHFCGNPGEPWCDYHKRIVFDKPSGKNNHQKAKEIDINSGLRRAFG